MIVVIGITNSSVFITNLLFKGESEQNRVMIFMGSNFYNNNKLELDQVLYCMYKVPDHLWF